MKKQIISTLLFLLLTASPLFGAETEVEVFPAAPYSRFIIYESLAVLWLFIISLIVIIRMKLREIERTQKLGINRKEDKVPSLE